MINFINKTVRDTVSRFGRAEELDNKKILAIILVSLAIIYLDYSLVIKLQFRGVKTVNSKIIKLKKDIKAYAKDSAILEDIKRRQGKPHPVSLDKRAISEGEITALLQDISSLANRRNIRIIQIKPSKELKAKEEKVSSQARFTPNLITLDVSCGYHNLGAFVNDLENARQFMAVQSLKIKSDPRDYFRQNANLALKTYVKK